MTLETEERDRCRRGLVSCCSGWEQTVESAREPRALSVRTVPVRSSWDVCPWMLPRSSSYPEPPVTLDSLPCRLFAGLQISSSLRPFLEILSCFPAAWHTARSDPFLSSLRSR